MELGPQKNVRMDNGICGLWPRYMEKIREDPCIGPSHISVLVAIIFQYKRQGEVQPVRAFARDLMSYAKISSHSTFVRCIATLVRFRYIRYQPSFDPAVGSEIYLI